MNTFWFITKEKKQIYVTSLSQARLSSGHPAMFLLATPVSGQETSREWDIEGILMIIFARWYKAERSSLAQTGGCESNQWLIDIIKNDNSALQW